MHFIPLHLHPAYRRLLEAAPASLPHASAAYERVVSLPIFPGMTDEDVARVVDAVHETLRTGRR